jgi:hypothetical protein
MHYILFEDACNVVSAIDFNTHLLRHFGGVCGLLQLYTGEWEKYVEEGSGLFPGYGGPALSRELLD